MLTCDWGTDTNNSDTRKSYQYRQQTLYMKGIDKDNVLNKKHFYGIPQSLLILRRVFCGWFACLLFITPAKLASVAFLSADFKLPLSEECAVNHQLETIAHSHFSSRGLLSSAFSFWSSVRKPVKQNSFCAFQSRTTFSHVIAICKLYHYYVVRLKSRRVALHSCPNNLVRSSDHHALVLSMIIFLSDNLHLTTILKYWTHKRQRPKRE